MGLALSGEIDEGNDKTAPFSVDGVNGGVYINRTVYGDKSMTALRTIFLDYDARREPKTNEFCIRCQRDFRPGQKRRWVHLIDGGINVLHPSDEGTYTPDGGDMGMHEIGTDCARRIGTDYTWPPEAVAK